MISSSLPAPQNGSALAAERVAKRYDSIVALDDVSLELATTGCLALVGESGSGKTTLLRCFNRLVEPDRGVIRVGGIDVSTQDPVALRRSIGYVPQDGGLLPHWRVRRNVELVLRLNGHPSPRERADDALRLVGLDPDRYAGRWPRELSGGQRQRVAIARALAVHPKIVLADEPTANLDSHTAADLLRTMKSLNETRGTTFLISTHDSMVMEFARRLITLRDGRIAEDRARA